MSAQDFVRDYKAGTARLTAAYGYNPAEEIDACGVGLVVAHRRQAAPRGGARPASTR